MTAAPSLEDVAVVVVVVESERFPPPNVNPPSKRASSGAVTLAVWPHAAITSVVAMTATMRVRQVIISASPSSGGME
jgi:hypothetical protein